MSDFSRPIPTPQAKDAVVDGEYAAAPSSRSADPMVAALTGPQAQPRVDAVRRGLDRALDGWWRSSALPASGLLRDGLLLLEAGHRLDEAQRSLLLRGALAYRRGMLTALRYQTDPERTAVILAEALLEGEQPLRPDELAQLARSDDLSGDWQPALRLALQQDAAHPDPVRRNRVAAALAVVAEPGKQGALAPAAAQGVALASAAAIAVESDGEIDEAAVPQPGRPWLRFALILLLLGVVAGVFFWQQRAARDMVLVPAGVYVLRAADDSQRSVELAAFAIDNFEATNAAYRRCVEQNGCGWPSSTTSATRPHYFLSPAFANYPVVNVDWANAARFCAFIGKRLPTADEWEVAASHAPATGRAYRYPWGDQFLVQAANSGLLGLGDTTAAGAYRPTGDSPLGLSDMAGNVAEWTATAVDTATVDAATGAAAGDAVGQKVVKGGSFRDDAARLQPAASVTVTAAHTATWLGFRCAASTAQP